MIDDRRTQTRKKKFKMKLEISSCDSRHTISISRLTFAYTQTSTTIRDGEIERKTFSVLDMLTYSKKNMRETWKRGKYLKDSHLLDASFFLCARKCISSHATCVWVVHARTKPSKSKTQFLRSTSAAGDFYFAFRTLFHVQFQLAPSLRLLNLTHLLAEMIPKSSGRKI